MRIFTILMVLGTFATLCGCKATQANLKGEAANGWNEEQNLEFSKVADSSTTEKGLQLSLKGDFLFEVGSSKMSQDGIQKIDSIVAILTKYPKDQVAILEYTDNSGSSPKNLRLSQKRANAIKTELVKQGIPETKITAIGKGDANPIVSNDTAENRAQNRRAELDVTQS